MVGERQRNIPGSKAVFARMIREGNYDEALVGTAPGDAGAQHNRHNMDEGLIERGEGDDAVPSTSSPPSRTSPSPHHDRTAPTGGCDRGGAELVPGTRSSIVAEQARTSSLAQARLVKRYGAAQWWVMGSTGGSGGSRADRKARSDARAYKLLTEEVGSSRATSSFDVNILTVGTGPRGHNNYAVEFIDGGGGHSSGGVPESKTKRRGKQV